jgi:hypothetical protein
MNFCRHREGLAMYNGFRCGKHFKPPKRINFVAVFLIAAGVLLVIFFTPPWVWFVLLGLGLILAGIFSLRKWR